MLITMGITYIYNGRRLLVSNHFDKIMKKYYDKHYHHDYARCMILLVSFIDKCLSKSQKMQVRLSLSN